MRLSNFDLVAIAIMVACGALLVERGNRVSIEVSAPAQVSVLPSPTCPANESVPFSAECMAFIESAPLPLDLRRLSDSDLTHIDSPELR